MSKATAYEDPTLKKPDIYHAGKWGRYLRAPDFYFQVMRDFQTSFVKLGEIVSIRFGIKTGCDGFFMPHDLTTQVLTKYADAREFKKQYGVDRSSVETRKIKIIKAGDGSVHPIEAEFLAPELHSPMEIDRPLVEESLLRRVVLLVNKPRSELRRTWVAHYIRYGETQPFASKKSRPVPVAERSTCAARDPWYDLTGLVKPGVAFWPMAQQYRHIIPANPGKLINRR